MSTAPLDTPSKPVFWQPEPGAPWEPFCRCDGSDEAAERIVSEILDEGPEGADATIEKQSDRWLPHLQDPPEG